MVFLPKNYLRTFLTFCKRITYCNMAQGFLSKGEEYLQTLENSRNVDNVHKACTVSVVQYELFPSDRERKIFRA